MCGLAGIAGSLVANDHKTFSELLMISSFRGIDSTGIAVKSFDKQDVTVFKHTVPSPEFLDFRKAQNLIKENNEILMGHCRSKTIGEVKKANAQPFDFENIVGTHNGTLSSGMKGRLEGRLYFGTDSEALYFHIAANGLKSAVEQGDDKDAMALVWYDKDKRELNFYRNAQRPLWYCFDKKRTKIYWASESAMLYLVLNRAGENFGKVKQLPENLHFTLAMPEKQGAEFDKPVTRFCEPKKAAAAVSSAAESARYFVGSATSVGSGVGTGPGGRTYPVLVAGKDTVQGSLPLTSGAFRTGTTFYKGEVRSVDTHKFNMSRMVVKSDALGGSYYISSNMKIYHETDFENKCAEGCAVCGITPLWGEPVKFLKDESILCASCISEAKEQYMSGQKNGSTLVLLEAML